MMDERSVARQIAAIFGRSCREPSNDFGLDPALDSAAEVVASVRAEARTEYRVELDAYIRTLRNFRDNWDCDEDAHAHGTTCRACEAADVLSHFARGAILADESPQNDGKPEVGDLVISASSQAVQWNGLPDPWYWTTEDEIAMQDETIVVIRRAAEIKRKIEEAKE